MGKKAWLIGALLLGCAPLAAAEGKGVDDTRNVGDFTGIEMEAGISAKVTAGPIAPIVVSGEEDVVKHVRTRVLNGVLDVDFEPGYSKNGRVNVALKIQMPRARSFSASGGSHIEAAVPAADELTLNASGGAEIDVTTKVQPKSVTIDASGGATVSLPSVDTDKATLDLSGAAQVTIGGRADDVDLDASGGSQLDAAGLAARSLHVDGSGAARAKVKVSQLVKGELSGASHLRVPAGANVKVDTSGGSQVKQDL